MFIVHFYTLLQSPQDAVTPFQILGGEAQIVQVLVKHQIFSFFFLENWDVEPN